jgi:hypothetical protein
MVPDRVAEAVAGLLSKAAEHVAQKLADGDVADEPDFSGQFCGAATAMFDVSSDIVPGVRLSARQLTSRGKGSEEKRYGADIVVALNYELPDYQVSKGMLVQAKMGRDSVRPAARSWEADIDDRLETQCRNMLAHTPASFVFLYAPGDVTAYPAAQIIASRFDGLTSDTTYPLNTLFYDFGICWVGDTNIKATDRGSLRNALEEYNARHGLLVQASSSDARRTHRKVLRPQRW